jgi:hypothetical protein
VENDLGMREEKRLCRNVGRNREGEVMFKARRAKIKPRSSQGVVAARYWAQDPNLLGKERLTIRYRKASAFIPIH